MQMHNYPKPSDYCVSKISVFKFLAQRKATDECKQAQIPTTFEVWFEITSKYIKIGLSFMNEP